MMLSPIPIAGLCVAFAAIARSAKVDIDYSQYRQFSTGHLDETNGVRIMSYNVMANKWALHKWFNEPTDMYFKWDNRSKRLIEEIKAYSADVIALQVHKVWSLYVKWHLLT